MNREELTRSRRRERLESEDPALNMVSWKLIYTRLTFLAVLFLVSGVPLGFLLGWGTGVFMMAGAVPVLFLLARFVRSNRDIGAQRRRMQQLLAGRGPEAYVVELGGAEVQDAVPGPVTALDVGPRGEGVCVVAPEGLRLIDGQGLETVLYMDEILGAVWLVFDERHSLDVFMRDGQAVNLVVVDFRGLGVALGRAGIRTLASVPRAAVPSPASRPAEAGR